MLVLANALAESPEPVDPVNKQDFDLIRDAPTNSGMSFEVFVFRDAGWSEIEVERVIDEARQIYAGECRFSLIISSMIFISVAPELHRINYRLQEQLLIDLGDVQRPVIFFIDDTLEYDFAAYAYLQDTASPSQGTAWITRNAAKQCRGPMLAHEIGHIALNADKHVLQNNNLMAFSCQRSNVSRQSINTDLTPEQCETLWGRHTN